MSALSDPKLELFSQRLLLHLANGMSGGKAAEAAAREAGYRGSSMAANARKRAQRPDVKARMVELAAPKRDAAEAEIAETCEAVQSRMFKIALHDVDADHIKVSDQIGASNLLARMKGWLAPEKREHSGPDGGPIEMTSDADRARALAGFIARVANKSGA